jgi:hypothetical protein
MSGLTIALIIIALIVTGVIAAMSYELIDVFALSLRVRSIYRCILTSVTIIVAGLIFYLGTHTLKVLAIAGLLIPVCVLGHFIEWMLENRKVGRLVRLSQLRNEAYKEERLDDVERYQKEIKSIQKTISWNLQELEDNRIL